jgi:hypothetical protein
MRTEDGEDRVEPVVLPEGSRREQRVEQRALDDADGQRDRHLAEALADLDVVDLPEDLDELLRQVRDVLADPADGGSQARPDRLAQPPQSMPLSS